jgi:hypothetical protein
MPNLGADSILGQFDQNVTNNVQMTIVGQPVKFQFPPRVTSDTKTSNWKTIWFPSWEPIKYYWGSEARAITMEAEWMASGSVWTPSAISKQLQDIRAYFYDAKVGGDYPLVRLKIYDIVPSSAPFRLMDFGVSYGDAIKGGNGIFPLYSKGTFKLELATQVAGKPVPGGASVDKPKVKVGSLPPIQPEWK